MFYENKIVFTCLEVAYLVDFSKLCFMVAYEQSVKCMYLKKLSSLFRCQQPKIIDFLHLNFFTLGPLRSSFNINASPQKSCLLWRKMKNFLKNALIESQELPQ